MKLRPVNPGSTLVSQSPENDIAGKFGTSTNEATKPITSELSQDLIIVTKPSGEMLSHTSGPVIVIRHHLGSGRLWTVFAADLYLPGSLSESQHRSTSRSFLHSTQEMESERPPRTRIRQFMMKQWVRESMLESVSMSVRMPGPDVTLKDWSRTQRKPPGTHSTTNSSRLIPFTTTNMTLLPPG